MYRYKYERYSKLGCTCFAEVRVKLSVSPVATTINYEALEVRGKYITCEMCII